jgi:uncharacterized protein YajQ (UPF0234 family)
MKLVFKVLWFENQPTAVDPALKALRTRLDEHGFELELTMEENDSRVDVLSDRQDKFHDTDLVVVDFDLGDESAKGDAVAKKIRNGFSFTDIIFYSGSPLNDLRERVKDQAIDGVYCMSRNDLRAQLIERVDDVVRRMSRLESMRGLAAVTAGRGDQHLRSILTKIHDALDTDGQQELVKAIDDEVQATAQRNQVRYAALGDLDARIHDFACTSIALLKAAKLVVGKHPELQAFKTSLGQYQPQVIEVRNKLSHIVEQEGEDGWVIVSKSDVITKGNFPDFRKGFSNQLKNLASIDALVAGEGQ